ncbi:MAG: endonuclease dU [Promethearchaeota archaeon]
MINFIKKGIQIVAIDDAPHERGNIHTHLAFVFCRGMFLEHFLHARIKVDGLDATDVVIKTLSPHANLFRLVVTHGITVGGFNMLDIKQLMEVLEKPVISVTENKPNDGALELATSHLHDQEKRLELISRAGPLYHVKTDAGKNELFFHAQGIRVEIAKRFLKKFSVRSRLPECLLLAHKIATGLKMES